MQDSQYAHLLDPPQRAADAAAADAQKSHAADGAAAAEPASAQGGAAPGQAADGMADHTGRAAAGSGGGTAADAAADVHLHLSCQKFVELVRGTRIDEAVEFGQKVCLLGRFCALFCPLHVVRTCVAGAQGRALARAQKSGRGAERFPYRHF